MPYDEEENERINNKEAMRHVKTKNNPVKEESNFIIEKVKEVSLLKKQYDADQIKFVKNLINPDLTDNELFLFMNFASAIQLNPMNGEIIPIVYGKGTNDRKVNTITTRNGKRVIASRTGQLDSILTDPIYVREKSFSDSSSGKTVEGKEMVRCEPWEGGVLWGAESTVTRKGKEFTATVPFKEYNTGRNVWSNKPETMIKKVAESQALSMAFPEILGGIYDEVEVMEQPEERENKIAGTIESALKERKEARTLEPEAKKVMDDLADKVENTLNGIEPLPRKPKEEVKDETVTARD